MRRLLLSLVFLLSSSVLFAAATAQVTYTEGGVFLKPKTGAQRELEIGDTIHVGDTVRTGVDGGAELSQAGVTLRISPSTVFTLMEREQNGQTRAVAAISLGSLKMRYDKLTGQEPLIRTASCQAGVRGTELTVVSGPDGSSLIAVDSGAVEVSAEGKAVSLAAGEGVEVAPGQAPGIKFEVQRNQIDYRKWNEGKLQAMLADPVAALAAIRAQMESYVQNVKDYDAAFATYSHKLADAQAIFAGIFKDKGKDAAQPYNVETLIPLTIQTGHLFLNKRFNALAALSLRRYVAGRLYVLLKPTLLMESPPWASQFQKSYSDLLAYFESEIAPHLLEPDI